MSVEYRVYVDDQPAPNDFAQAIEQIEVQQGIEETWEATLTIPSCMDGNGLWSAEADDHMASYRRMRLEVRAGGEWIPLIDGPTVAVDLGLSGDPGQSSSVIRIRDDSVFLDRTEREHAFDPDLELDQVVREAFELAEGITLTPEIDVASACEPERAVPRSRTIRGSVWAFLNRLARDHGLYVRVLPGETAGRSQAVFGPLPKPDGNRAPALVLAGTDRNLESFDISMSHDRPGRVSATSVRVEDREVEAEAGTLDDLELLADEPAVGDAEVTELVEPGATERVGTDCAARAHLRRRSFAIEANGSVAGRCYHGVLRPYQHVDVAGVHKRVAGTYMVKAVTHTIDRGGYRQTFTLWRDAINRAASDDLSGSIF